MVPVALRPTRDASRPRRLWSNPGYGWNRLALPPPVGRARASLLDEPGRGVAWQRPPLVLPRRRFRHGTEESTRSRRPVRRGAPGEPEHSNKGVLTARSGRILRHHQRALAWIKTMQRLTDGLVYTKDLALSRYGEPDEAVITSITGPSKR